MAEGGPILLLSCHASRQEVRLEGSIRSAREREQLSGRCGGARSCAIVCRVSAQKQLCSARAELLGPFMSRDPRRRTHGWRRARAEAQRLGKEMTVSKWAEVTGLVGA